MTNKAGPADGPVPSHSPFRISNFLKRHPLVRDAILWSIPAVFLGLVLRLLLLHYSPYAYWGSDSRSYFGFTNGVMTEFYFSINEKRRYLYPLLMLPVTLLPGAALKALAWIQAGLGLAAIFAFGYVVRRVFAGWKILIVPLTALLAGLPVFIWYEHELIAESVYFNGIVWMLAGWAAWTCQRDPARARRLFWWFFVPLALMALTKPSVKFLWPGIVIALVAVLAWRMLRWPQWTALVALFFAGATVGDDDQSAWLLYTTAFPLTQVDAPKHAEYKAEIRDWVLERRADLDRYEERDDAIHDFLREPEVQDERLRWRDLAKNDENALEKLYNDLALEGIAARPDLFLYIAMQRLVGSANMTDFKDDRFGPTYFADRFAEQLEKDRNPETMVRLAFALPVGEPVPDVAQFREWLAPRSDSPAVKWLTGYVRAYQSAGVLIDRPEGPRPSLWKCRLTPLGWCVVIGGLLALIPPYLRTVGVWVIAFAGATLATYMVGIEHTRYFAAVWPVVFLALGVIVDLPIRVFRRAFAG